MTTNETSQAQSLSHRITQWAENNNWYHTKTQTNQVRLEQTFGQSIEAFARDLDSLNHPILRRYLFDHYYLLMAKCRKIDIASRAGCRNVDDILEMEFLHIEARSQAAGLADLIRIIQNFVQYKLSMAEHEMPAKSSKEPTADTWITFDKAAEIMGVTKGTISKWANEGKLQDNGLKRKKRNLLKTSVLLLKQDLEDKAVGKDINELRDDARKLKIAG